MAGLNSHNHHTAPAPRTELISNHGITLVISSRHEGPRTTTALPELPAPQVPAFGTTCRELFHHLAALARTIFTLYVLPLVLLIRACLSLNKILLQSPRNTLLDLPNWGRGLRSFVNSQICSRSFTPEEFIDLVIFFPIRVTHAILEFLEAKTRFLITSTSPGSVASSGKYVGDSIAIRLIECSYLPSVEYDNVQHECRIPQTLDSATLDDIPSLEQHYIASPASNSLEQYPSAYMNRFRDSPGYPIDALPTINLPALTDQAKDEVQVTGLNERALEGRELGGPIIIDSDQSSTDLLQSPQEPPKSTTWPVHSSKESRLDRSEERRRQGHPGAPARRSHASSITSDPAKAESFSPIQFTPRTSRIYSWEGMRYLSSYSTGSRDADQPPSLAPDAPDASTSEHDRSSNPADSGPSTPGRNFSHHSINHARSSEKSSVDIQSPYKEINPLKEDSGWYLNETKSHKDEPTLVNLRSTRQQEPEADELSDTCVSCETCNRRHRRTCPSKIPRKVKKVEPFRPRSSSFGGYHSTPSAASASTALRNKLRKRKSQVH
jgi:hypothetical protein